MLTFASCEISCYDQSELNDPYKPGKVSEFLSSFLSLAFFRLGNQAYAGNDFSKAVDLYSRAIQKDPQNHVYFSNRSASYGGLDQWDKARDDAKECIRLDPSFVKGYYRLASAQIALQDHDAALATIRQGLAVDPNNPQLNKQMKIAQQRKKIEHAKAQAPASLPSATNSNVIASGLDAATVQELQELQQQYGQTNRELQTVEANRTKMEREHQITALTLREIQDVPETAACYRSCGKMFLRTKQPEMLQHLDQRLEGQTKAEQDMAKQIEYLQRKLLSQRQNIEELVGNAGGGLVASNS